MKRSGKFYYRNEKETLTALGLTPAPQSGAGWVTKEDGENERVLVQLKSTDAASYTLKSLDMKKLEYHASVSHKAPIFLVQFLQDNRIYAIVDIANLQEVHDALFLGKEVAPTPTISEPEEPVQRKAVKTSKTGRQKFFQERDEQHGKRQRKARH